MREPDLYIQHWDSFRKYCEGRAKDADCYINSKGWQKLREYHLRQYLKGVQNPYGFLFNIRMRHRNMYRQVQCMPKLYYKYLRKKQKEFDSPSRRVVQFPTWKGFMRSNK